MSDLIPISIYTDVYYIILFFFVIRLFIQSTSKYIYSLEKFNFSKYFALIVFAFVLMMMGLRPLSGVFTDMNTYNKVFLEYQRGIFVDSKDLLFGLFIKSCSYVMNSSTWFFTVALFYVGFLYMACKKIFPLQSGEAFIMCITSFTFWAYGTNTIRAGLAASIIIFAISQMKLPLRFHHKINLKKRKHTAGKIVRFKTLKKLKNILIFIPILIIGIGIHSSMVLPVGALLISLYYKETKFFIIFWISCIVLSYIFGGRIESVFLSLEIPDDRFSDYLTNEPEPELFHSTGFRWDFIIYSSVPIIMGYYAVIKRNIYDEFYSLILNTYILTNAIWILIIRANYSDRFAYLSWFLFPLVIIYPALKFKLWNQQYFKVSLIVMTNFLFTYFMYLIRK